VRLRLDEHGQYRVNWAEYWNGETTLYANARHRRVHYETVARDIIGHLPAPDARVVDYGCGDTLAADRVARCCGHLHLCDGSPRVREMLNARYAGERNITVISPQQFEQFSARAIDMIVANSVVQYLSAAEFSHLLVLSREKLSLGGRLVLADIIPHGVGPLQDALELMKFASTNGFVLSAAAGLVRSYFSNYRQIRERSGFLQFEEREMLNVLEQSGFAAHRHYPNMGHNGRRMSFVASPSDSAPIRPGGAP
jgi:hypothetical protein